MLLRTLTFENFGIYAGVHTFDLTPDDSGQFDRPIVLITGRNGVGKTTFVEGMRLCLHGPLALGCRVAQLEYETYLAGRIHRPLHAKGSGESTSTGAAVELTFDFVSLGKRQRYRVRRQWARHNRRLVHELQLWENGISLDMLPADDRETLLRELAPPGLTSIFFFDGEKIDALAQDAGSNLLLAETVNALLGLNLIDQLQRDLDVFLARHGTEDTRNGAHHELEGLVAQRDVLEQSRLTWRAQLADLQQQVEVARQRVAGQEAQIAAEGGSYAGQRQALQERRAHIDLETEVLRRRAQELANGLLPFAVAPDMLRAVRKRLAVEQTFQEQQAARQLVERQLTVLQREMDQSAFWVDGSQDLQAPVRRQIYRQVAGSLRGALLADAVAAEEVILHVSDKERGQLTQWIDQALADVPLAFSRLAQQLTSLEQEATAVDADLARVPADEVLVPLVERLHELLRELGGLEQTQAQAQEKAQRVDYELDQTDAALRHARHAIEQTQSAQRRSELAANTQRVLDDYKATLTQRKVALLEQSLVSHFDQLCRKNAFIDRISVAPATFELTLHRAGHSFTREQLSAGENQLLAIATLWALRELSGRATPVVIDTPLSRLDSQHRERMLHDFFPRASHQVILLATDAEIDAHALKLLAPVISRLYRMEYDPATGATTHTTEQPQVKTINLPLFADGAATMATAEAIQTP